MTLVFYSISIIPNLLQRKIDVIGFLRSIHCHMSWHLQTCYILFVCVFCLKIVAIKDTKFIDPKNRKAFTGSCLVLVMTYSQGDDYLAENGLLPTEGLAHRMPLITLFLWFFFHNNSFHFFLPIFCCSIFSHLFCKLLLGTL